MGHREVREILKVPVYVEEKVDGSQFSFGRVNGELFCRSRGQEINIDAPEKMFTLGVQTAKNLLPWLTDGWTYRGEFLNKPKHNSLTYGRVPKDNIIIFDINDGLESYLPYWEKHAEASRLNLETVPLFYEGLVESTEFLLDLMQRHSILGDVKIEGVVLKPVTCIYGEDKKALIAKLVSADFKELHQKNWKNTNTNPTQGDVIELLVSELRTNARWQKAVQHLRESGTLEESPKDIGKLINEVKADVKIECSDYIQERLFKWAWHQIERKLVAGLPEWYKEELLKLCQTTNA
jgi:hypothetical protein